MNKTVVMGIAVLVMSTAAFAGPVDFTNSDPWRDGDGDSSFSAEGLTLTANPPGARLNWSRNDGFGISYSGGFDADEVEGPEVLTLTFDAPTLITELYITDLYNEHEYLEAGYYQLDDGPLVAFQADPTKFRGSSNGELTIPVDVLVLSTITFTGAESSSSEDHEFSVAGFSTPTPHPEPGTMALLLSAAAAGAACRRRRRRSA